jgi:uncharacterized phage-associated protein
MSSLSVNYNSYIHNIIIIEKIANKKFILPPKIMKLLYFISLKLLNIYEYKFVNPKVDAKNL